MNTQTMITDLYKLQREWEYNEKSPDLADRGQWVKGIVYGIKLAIRLVQKNVYPGNLEKATTDLDALQQKRERREKSRLYQQKRMD